MREPLPGKGVEGQWLFELTGGSVRPVYILVKSILNRWAFKPRSIWSCRACEENVIIPTIIDKLYLKQIDNASDLHGIIRRKMMICNCRPEGLLLVFQSLLLVRLEVSSPVSAASQSET